MELDEINHTIGRRIKGIDYIYIYIWWITSLQMKVEMIPSTCRAGTKEKKKKNEEGGFQIN